MNCVETSANLEAMFDETLDTVSRANVKEHVAVCAKCQADWLDLQELRRLLRESMVIAPSETLDERSLKAFDDKWPIRAAEVAVKTPWWKQGITIPVPAFALSLVLLVGILWSFSAWNRRDDQSIKRATPADNQRDATSGREAVDLSRFDHGERAVIYVERGASPRSMER